MSFLNCLQSSFCADWSQPVQGVGMVGGCIGLGAGAGTGNVPLAVVSGGLLTTSVLGSGRVGYLKPYSNLGENARSLVTTAQSLNSMNEETVQKIRKLEETRSSLQTQFDREHLRAEGLLKEKEGNINYISTLTQELSTADANVQKMSQSALRIKQILNSQQSETQRLATLSDDQKSASRSLAQSSSALASEVTLLESGVQGLAQQNQNAAAQIAKMTDMLNRLQQEEDRLKDALQKLQTEKDALQHLVSREETAASIQEKIDIGTKKLDALNQRYQQMIKQLAELQNKQQE